MTVYTLLSQALSLAFNYPCLTSWWGMGIRVLLPAPDTSKEVTLWKNLMINPTPATTAMPDTHYRLHINDQALNEDITFKNPRVAINTAHMSAF